MDELHQRDVKLNEMQQSRIKLKLNIDMFERWWYATRRVVHCFGSDSCKSTEMGQNTHNLTGHCPLWTVPCDKLIRMICGHFSTPMQQHYLTMNVRAAYSLGHPFCEASSQDVRIETPISKSSGLLIRSRRVVHLIRFLCLLETSEVELSSTERSQFGIITSWPTCFDGIRLWPCRLGRRIRSEVVLRLFPPPRPTSRS